MKITFFGTGYVGLVTGTCFADLGNEVTCVDINNKKISDLNEGKIPIYEPGLKELIERNVKQRRLFFTTKAEEAIKSADIIFIAVGTPQKENGQAELKYVLEVGKTIGKYLNQYKVIVNKSTVPVGTAEKVTKEISSQLKERGKEIEFDVVSNPEFLKEGAAIKDFQVPDRVVIGTDSEKAKEIMEDLYSAVTRMDRPIVFMDTKSAELTKYASNAMLAVRISFMNEISSLCEEIGADIKQVAKGMGLDSRIGPKFLSAGIGYGGSCFPKDVRALAHMLESYDGNTNIIRSADYVNERQKKSAIPKLKKMIPQIEGKKIAIWGLSFKPKTDDIRESPAITIINQLQEEYAEISAYDPEGMEEMKKKFANITYTTTSYEAVKDADVLMILTEWDEFRKVDLERIKESMKGKIIFDGRNIFNPEKVREIGFKYIGVGRK
jgi:UDPglucose 6-dehydrogenase